jgi:lipoprotein-releasing system permease protein
MFSPFERLVAGRYLRARKQEGFVSVIAGFSFLGIMLGVATLIIVMSVMNGFRAELLGRILGLNGHISVYSSNGPLMDYGPIVKRIQGVSGVVSATPIVESQALLSANGVNTGVLVRGIDPADFQKKSIIVDALIAGRAEDFAQDGVAIGSALAERLKLRVGDPLTLTSSETKVTPFGSMPMRRTFPVAAIFDVGMYEYNNGFVYMPLAIAKTFFQIPERGISNIEVFIEQPVNPQPVGMSIHSLVNGLAVVSDWRATNGSFFNALQVERNVMFLILTLIIIVAAFNIISSMIMLVKDKGRDIAIMRTMGASRRSMMKIFILTGASIGFLGTAVGAIAGIAFAVNIESIRQWLEGLTNTELFSDEIYFLSQLPAQVEWHEVIVVILMAFILSILATLYPAWRAARLHPVEALRYE